MKPERAMERIEQRARRDFLRICALAGLGSLVPLWAPGRVEAILRTGGIPPEVTLKDLRGKNVALPGDFKGNLVVVHFWASWCNSCLPEMKTLEALHAKYREKGFTACSVALGDSKESAESYLRPVKISYPILLAKVSVARQYGVSGVPTSFILDRKGTVRSKIIGTTSGDALENIVRTFL
jgi:cytochrome c biogenesis protein CcmG, thiol:disulfide interchange protein DsbE